jgi:membrane protease YdiL (CAAX protease family)
MMVLAPTLASFSLIMAEFVGLLVAMKLLALYQKRIGFPEIPTLSTMGLRSRSRGAVQLAIGWGLSALLIGGIFGGLWLGGWVKVEGIRLTTSSGMPMPAWLAGYVLLFAIAAFCEEVALRGFVLQNLARVHSELVG